VPELVRTSGKTIRIDAAQRESHVGRHGDAAVPDVLVERLAVPERPGGRGERGGQPARGLGPAGADQAGHVGVGAAQQFQHERGTDEAGCSGDDVHENPLPERGGGPFDATERTGPVQRTFGPS
jgi:hypothetical protein